MYALLYCQSHFQLFERRKKCAIRREIPIMQALNEKFMSDEESDAEDKSAFVRRSLKWRSEKLNELLKKLDERYLKSREKKDNSRPMKNRKLGSPSDRSPPANAPDWAITTDNNGLEAVETEVLSGICSTSHSPLGSGQSTSNSPLGSAEITSDCEDSETDDWIYQVTGVRA